MVKSERERKLHEMVKEGDRAETLSDFLSAFVEAEKAKALNDLLKTTRSPEMVRADLRATMRLAEYINGIIQFGKLAKVKLEESK